MSHKFTSTAAEKESKYLTQGSTGFKPASLTLSPLILTLTASWPGLT